MKMIAAEELTTLFLTKKAVYGIRRGSEFLPKGATIVAVFIKEDDTVTALSQATSLTSGCDTHELRPRYNPVNAAACFAAFWEKGASPLAILGLLNNELGHIDDVVGLGPTITQIVKEILSPQSV